MKAVRLTLAGRECHLALTVEAMFQLEDLFGGTGELLDAMGGTGRESFQAACKAAAVLAEQGELARRHLGYDPAPMPALEDVLATMTPDQLPAVKLAVSSAVSLGFGREIEPENDEVDVGLAELNGQKKRGNAGALPQNRDAVWIWPEGDAAGPPRGAGGRLGAVFAGSRGKEKGRGGGIEPGLAPRPASATSVCAQSILQGVLQYAG